jgi:hypothetical protein
MKALAEFSEPSASNGAEGVSSLPVPPIASTSESRSRGNANAVAVGSGLGEVVADTLGCSVFSGEADGVDTTGVGLDAGWGLFAVVGVVVGWGLKEGVAELLGRGEADAFGVADGVALGEAETEGIGEDDWVTDGDGLATIEALAEGVGAGGGGVGTKVLR